MDSKLWIPCWSFTLEVWGYQAPHKAGPFILTREWTWPWNIPDVFTSVLEDLYWRTDTPNICTELFSASWHLLLLLPLVEKRAVATFVWEPFAYQQCHSQCCSVWLNKSNSKNGIRLVDQKMVPCGLKTVNQSTETWDEIMFCYLYLSLLWNLSYPRQRGRTSMDVTLLQQKK